MAKSLQMSCLAVFALLVFLGSLPERVPAFIFDSCFLLLAQLICPLLPPSLLSFLASSILPSSLHSFLCTSPTSSLSARALFLLLSSWACLALFSPLSHPLRRRLPWHSWQSAAASVKSKMVFIAFGLPPSRSSLPRHIRGKLRSCRQTLPPPAAQISANKPGCHVFLGQPKSVKVKP